jgi:predicted negative regulator of RcsB-dependent stress response
MGLHVVDIEAWQDILNVKDWWSEGIHKKGALVKAMASLVMLISWEIWNERNARVFRQHFSTSTMITNRIKEAARVWCLAGAKLCVI